MIVSLFLTDQQAVEILERHGIVNKVTEVVRYRSAYHNQLEAYNIDELQAFHPDRKQWLAASEMIKELMINNI